MDQGSERGNDTKPLLYVFIGIAVIALIAVVFVVLSRSQADTQTQSATVSNAAPTIGTVVTALTDGGAQITNFTTTEGTTTQLFWNTTATDSNGCAQIDDATTNVASKFYRTNVTNGYSCTAGDNDCYTVATADTSDGGCTDLTGGSDLDVSLKGNDLINYYADATGTGADTYSATTWTTEVKVTDDDNGTAAGTNTWENAATFQLGLGAAISHGTVALSAQSAEQTFVVSNTGNEAIDYDLAVDGPMACTIGTIAVASQKYALTASVAYGTKSALSTTPIEVDPSIAKSTGTASTSNLYLQIGLPTTGVEGSCSSTLTLVAEDNA